MLFECDNLVHITELTTLAIYQNIIALKVAVNTRLLLSHRMEGIARFIHETTRRMVLAHPELEFHFLFDREYDSKFIYADNVIAHVLKPPARHPVLWHIWFEYSVHNFLKKNDIDVFLSGDMYLSLRSKVPCVYVSHDLNYLHYPEGLKWSHLKFLQYYFPKFHKKAESIIAVSEFTKNDIIKQYGISKEKISVAYNSVPDGFSPIGEKGKEAVRNTVTGGKEFFLYVGSLHPRKNLEGLIKAFEIFKNSNDSDYKLVIFGRKAFKTGRIFKLYSESKYKSDILFVDDSQYEVKDILPAAHALCYPSFFEGFGIPILEAFHSSVPVITSNVSSMPEVAGNAALLINPNEPENIAKAMAESLSESNRNRLIHEGHGRCSLFSWDKSAKIIFDKIKSLASQETT